MSRTEWRPTFPPRLCRKPRQGDWTLLVSQGAWFPGLRGRPGGGPWQGNVASAGPRAGPCVSRARSQGAARPSPCQTSPGGMEGRPLCNLRSSAGFYQWEPFPWLPALKQVYLLGCRPQMDLRSFPRPAWGKRTLISLGAGRGLGARDPWDLRPLGRPGSPLRPVTALAGAQGDSGLPASQSPVGGSAGVPSAPTAPRDQDPCVAAKRPWNWAESAFRGLGWWVHLSPNRRSTAL